MSGDQRPGVVATLLRALRDSPHATARTLAWTAVSAVPAFLHGYAIARALDDGFLAGDRQTGLVWLAVLGTASLVGAVGAGRAVVAIGDVVEPFRDRLVELVVTGALAEATRSHDSGRSVPRTVDDPLDDWPPHDLDSDDEAVFGTADPDASIARLSQQVEVIRTTLGASIVCVLGFLVTIGTAVAGQTTLAPEVLPLVVPPILASLLFYAVLMRELLRRERALVLGGEQLAAGFSAAMSGLRDVRALGAENRVCADVGVHIESQARLARAVGRLAAWRLLVVSLGSRLPVAFILLATPGLLDDGTSPGEIAGSLTYALAIIGPAMAALTEGFGAQVVPMWVTLARVLETAGDPTPPRGGNQQRAPEPALLRSERAAEIVVDDVTFAYSPVAEPVLRNFDLTIRPGEHFAVVGPSGIGKSTLAALLCGMLAPAAGTVRVGGLDPAALDLCLRARARVLIPQEAFVFTGTVRDNLLYLNPTASAAALEQAVHAVGMQPLLDRLGGYDAPLEPPTLSGGQRQLVALARAYLSPAPLAVLDEATCHLDPAAEARAEQAFAARPGTLVVIAHRITSALRADRILVLDGVAARVGTHEQLLEGSALYRDLVGHWSAADHPSHPTGNLLGPRGQ